MKKHQKILYDKESHVLSWEFGNGKSVDSDIQDNMVIDYDKKGNMVKLNIYNFSFSDFKEARKYLAKLRKSVIAVSS